MNCKHEFKSKGSSIIYYNGLEYHVEICFCIKCNKLYIRDFESGNKITFNGALGEEV